ncbi:MAG: hypothetical protein ACK5CO_01925, partial [Bacteroidota bacterium]
NLSYLSVFINLVDSRYRLNYPYQDIENFVYSDTGNTYHRFYSNNELRYSKLPLGNYKFKVVGILNDTIIFKDSTVFSINQNLNYEFQY